MSNNSKDTSIYFPLTQLSQDLHPLALVSFRAQRIESSDWNNLSSLKFLSKSCFQIVCILTVLYCTSSLLSNRVTIFFSAYASDYDDILQLTLSKKIHLNFKDQLDPPKTCTHVIEPHDQRPLMTLSRHPQWDVFFLTLILSSMTLFLFIVSLFSKPKPYWELRTLLLGMLIAKAKLWAISQFKKFQQLQLVTPELNYLEVLKQRCAHGAVLSYFGNSPRNWLVWRQMRMSRLDSPQVSLDRWGTQQKQSTNTVQSTLMRLRRQVENLNKVHFDQLSNKSKDTSTYSHWYNCHTIFTP